MAEDIKGWAGSFSAIDTRDLDAAISTCRERLGRPATSDAEMEAQLDYALALGMLLLTKARTEDALLVLDLSAEGRRFRFGPSDPRYGVGIAAHAEALLVRGHRAMALERASEAVSILVDAQHPLAAAAVALEAEILVRADVPATPFLGMDELEEPEVVRVAEETHARGRRLPPAVAHPLYAALDDFLAGRFPDGHPSTIRARAARARTAPDPEGKVVVLDALVGSLEAARAKEALVDALLERGLAESLAGDLDAALVTHELATERAREVTDRGVRARALRYLALLLLDVERPADAKTAVENAELEAIAASAHEEVARTVATKAVVLAYAGWFDAARAELVRAERLLDRHAPERAWIDLYRHVPKTMPRPVQGHLADGHARAHAEVST